MKYLNFFIPLLVLTTTILTSCESTKIKLSYAKEYEEVSEVFNKSSFDAFQYNIESKLSFITFVNNEDTCLCWSNLVECSENYIFENQLFVMTLAKDEIGDNKIEGYKMPSLYFPSILIFNKGKLEYQLDYKETNPVFKNTSDFKNYIEDKTINSKITILSKDSALKKLDSNDEFIIYFTKWYCPDCSSYTRYVLNSFEEKNYNNVKDNFYYVFDISSIKDNYQEFKDNMGLSNKISNLGYDVGYVPTIQYRNNKEIIAMDVFLNDKIESSIVTRSYYDRSMVEKQSFLDNNEEYILINKSLSLSDLLDKHIEISNLFLDNYFIKD